jgi:voltage-gated potassium channel
LREFADAGWSDMEFRFLLLLFAGQIAVGTVTFSLVEGWSLFNSLYFCVVSLTTVGYGDVTPESAAGKLITMVYLLLGVGLVVTFVSKVAALRVDVRARRRGIELRGGPPSQGNPVDDRSSERA